MAVRTAIPKSLLFNRIILIPLFKILKLSNPVGHHER
jgi:hypothetical protein